MQRIALSVFSLLFCLISKAQTGFGVHLHGGFMVPHHPDMVQMMTHVSGAELYFFKENTGSIHADSLLKSPRWGAGISYFNLGNTINGNAISAFAFIEPVFLRNKDWTMGGRMATGLGYITNPFDVFQNPQNRAIGSALNGRMQIGGFIKKEFHGTALLLNLDFIHFSNGNFSQPNLGINFPSVSIGFSGLLHHKKSVKKTTWLPTLDAEFSIRAGKRQMTFDDPRNIYPWLAELVLVYPHSPIRYWRGGINYFHDKSYLYKKFAPWPTSYHLGRVSEFSIFGGAEYRIGKMSFIADLGFYLYRPDKTKRMYYEGVGLRWYATPNIILMSRLKAHLSSADYFEWGLVYQIKGKRKVKPGFIQGFKYVFHDLWTPDNGL